VGFYVVGCCLGLSGVSRRARSFSSNLHSFYLCGPISPPYRKLKNGFSLRRWRYAPLPTPASFYVHLNSTLYRLRANALPSPLRPLSTYPSSKRPLQGTQADSRSLYFSICYFLPHHPTYILPPYGVTPQIPPNTQSSFGLAFLFFLFFLSILIFFVLDRSVQVLSSCISALIHRILGILRGCQIKEALSVYTSGLRTGSLNQRRNVRVST